MYRDPVKTAKSTYRMTMVRPTFRLAFLLASLSSHIMKICANDFGVDDSDFYVRLDDDLTFGVLMCTAITVCYFGMRRRGFDISALRYEDLLARPLEMCRVLLEFCNLPLSLTELAVKAFDVDSQRNSVISTSALRRFKEPQLTPQSKTKLNGLLKKYGIPAIGETHILEGTLSCSSSPLPSN